jgi:hypothetical protein
MKDTDTGFTMSASPFLSASVLAAIAAACFATASSAQAEGPPPLPPEAYAACASKADGDACTVRFHDREMQGICAPDREGNGLFCRLNQLPAPGPPEK